MVRTWNKAAPTVDGVYWWRMSENDPDPDICETDLQYSTVYDIGEPQGRSITELGGEWLGPIAPEASVIMPVIDRAPRFTVTSDRARRAAEEIEIEFPQLPNYSADKIAAIISKHFAATPADNEAERDDRKCSGEMYWYRSK